MIDEQQHRRASCKLAAKMAAGILAVLLLIEMMSPVIHSPAFNSPEAKIASETISLDAAFKAYRELHGSFPPSDFASLEEPDSPQHAAMVRHLRSAFPNCSVDTEIAAIERLGVRNPAQAICFWLGAFSADPQRPVSGLIEDPGGKQLSPCFPFDHTRLRHPAGEGAAPVYVPAGGGNAPYVYFSSDSYATQAAFDATSEHAGAGRASPYRADQRANGEFMNPNSFQIISAGLDDDFGGGAGSFPLW